MKGLLLIRVICSEMILGKKFASIAVLWLALAAPVAAQDVINVPSDWLLIPDGVRIGERFRLVGITTSGRNAQSVNIGDYNTFVQNDVKDNGHNDIKAYSSRFRALGSIRSNNAGDNLNMPNFGGVPVYWLNGKKIADDYPDFWDNSWDNSNAGDIRGTDGNVVSFSDTLPIWTGTQAGGLGSSNLLGDGRVRAGTISSTSLPISNSMFNLLNVGINRMYAVSPVFEAGSLCTSKIKTVPPNWPLIPPGIGPGETFRLVFASSTERDASSSDIKDYNDFVRRAAFNNGHAALKDLDCTIIFNALGSTETVDARDNLDMPLNDDNPTPVYWLNGEKVADNNEDFWDNNWDSGDLKTEEGVSGAARKVWTGTRTSEQKDMRAGRKDLVWHLGSSDFAIFGGNETTRTIYIKGLAIGQSKSLYGVSQKLVVGTLGCDFIIPTGSRAKPFGARPGDEFRVVFATSTKRDATSTDIEDYNAFVQQAVASKGEKHIRNCADQFKALGSTTSVDARDNINLGTSGGVPIYWLGGERIADDYADFWDNDWANSDLREEDGNRGANRSVWTGTAAGSGVGVIQLGNTGNTVTYGNGGSNNPVTHGIEDKNSLFSLYGVSPIFTVVDACSGISPTKPSGVTVGKKFHWLFLSSKTYTAESADIEFYNKAVQDLADTNEDITIRACAYAYKALASTETVDASANINLYPTNINFHSTEPTSGYEVSWLNGLIIAHNYSIKRRMGFSGFWSGKWENESKADWRNEKGIDAWKDQSAASIRVWTGTRGSGDGSARSVANTGKKQTASHLGRSSGDQVSYGIPGGSGGNPNPIDSGSTADKTNEYSIYGVSPELTHGTQVVFISPSYETNEGGNLTIRLKQLGEFGIWRDFNIPIVMDEARDNVSLRHNVSFRRSDSMASISIPIPHDTTDRPDKIFVLSFGTDNLPGNTFGGGLTKALAIIKDVDPTEVELLAPDAVSKTQRAITVQLGRTLVDKEEVDATVRFTGAMHDADYTVACTQGTGVNCPDSFTFNNNKRQTDVAITLSAGADGATLIITRVGSFGGTITAALSNSSASSLSGDISTPQGAMPSQDIKFVKPAIVRLRRTGDPVINEGTNNDKNRSDGATVRTPGGKLKFEVSLDRVLEAGESVDVPLTISGTGIDANDFGSLSKTFRQPNRGVSIEGIDSTTPTVIFAGEGAQIAHLELEAIDNELELDETATVALGDLNTDSDTNVEARKHPAQISAVVQIKDDEYVLCFPETRYSGYEDDDKIVVPVGLYDASTVSTAGPRPLNKTIVSGFSYSNTPPTSAADYLIVSEGYITTGTSIFNLEIPVTDDNVIEDKETFTVTLIPPRFPEGISRACSTNVEILDRNFRDIELSLKYTGRAVVPEGGDIKFDIETNRPLIGDEEIRMPLRISGGGITADDFESLDSLTYSIDITGATSIEDRKLMHPQSLRVSNDNEEEEIETVSIALGAAVARIHSRLSASNNPSRQSFTVDIEDAALSACFSEAEYRVGEGAANAVLPLALSSVQTTATELRFSYEDIDTDADDYSPVNLATVPAGQTTRNLVIPITDDDKNEGAESFVVDINLPSILPDCVTTATLTIIDNDPIIVQLTSSREAEVVEGDTLVFEISLNQKLRASEELSVPLLISGTATLDDDYTLECQIQTDLRERLCAPPGSPPEIIFLPGEMTARLELRTTKDNMADSGETVEINLRRQQITGTNISGDVKVHDANNRLSFTIVDILVSLSQSNYVVNEDVGSVGLTVALDGTVAQDIVIPLLVTRDATTQRQVRIAANSTSTSFNIEIEANAMDGADQIITVAIAASRLSSGISVGAITTATVLVKDNVPTIVQLRSSQEGNIFEGDAASFELFLSRALARSEALTVPLLFTGSTAMPDDYTLTCQTDVDDRDCGEGLDNTLPMVTLKSGETTATLTLSTIADNVYEYEEMVVISLGTLNENSGENLSGGAMEDNANKQVRFTIIDVLVSLSQSNYEVNEDEGSVELTVVMDKPADRDIDVPLLRETDDAATQSPVTIAAGKTTASYMILVDNNEIDEPDQIITIAIDASNLSNGVIVGAITTATVVIKDDDPTVVQLSSSLEGESLPEGGELILQITLGRKLAVSEALTVPLVFAGTAASDDYTLRCESNIGRDCSASLDNGKLAVALMAGEQSATLQLLTIPDNDNDVGETVEISFGTLDEDSAKNLNGGVEMDDANSLVDFTISAPPEVVKIGFTQPRFEVNEGAVAKLLALDFARSVDSKIILRAATNGTMQSVTIAANKLTAPYDIRLADDDIDGQDQNLAFVIDRSSLPEGVAVGAIATATVVVKDNDPTIVQLSSSQEGDIFEGDEVSFELSLSRALTGDEALTVPLVFSGAIIPDDYTLRCASDVGNRDCSEGLNSNTPAVTLTSGEMTATLTFVITVDAVYESTETAMISLGALDGNSGENLSGGATAHDTNNRLSFTVIDIADAPPVVSFSQSNIEVDESAGSAQLTVALDKTAKQAIAIPLLVTINTAAQSHTLTIPASHTTASFVLPIVNDEIDAPDQIFTVAIDTEQLSSDVVVGATATATVTIKDDDPTVVQLSSSLEGDNLPEGGAVEVQITLGRELSGAEELTVPLLFSGSTTQTDYELRSCETDEGRECSTSLDNSGNLLLTLMAGEQSATLRLLTIPDAEEDIGEILIIRLGTLDENSGVNLNGGVAIDTEDDQVEIEIGDRPDIIEIEFVQAEFEVAEGGRLAELLKLVDHIRSSDTEVILRMLMSGTTQSVTIAALSETVGYDSPIPDDDIDGQDLSLTLIIERSSLPEGVVVGAIATATVVVKDNDPTIVQLISSQEGEVFEGDAVMLEVSLGRALAGEEALTVPLVFTGTATSDDYTLTCQTDVGNMNCGINLNTDNPAISFISGETTATLTLSTTADNEDEVDKTVMISLGMLGENSGMNLSGGAIAHSTNNRLSFTLVDISVGFAQSNYEVNEDAGSVELTVVLDRTAEQNIDIPLLVTTDTMVQRRRRTILANHTTASFVIAIAAAYDNTTDDPDRTITIAIDTSDLPDGVAVGATATATVTIKDKDPTIVQLRSSQEGEITEGDAVMLEVSLSRALTGDEALTVPLAFSGTATSDDYTLRCESDVGNKDCGIDLNTDNPAISFISGETTATLTLTVTADNESDANEIMIINLGTLDANSGENLSGGAARGANNRLSFTLIDISVDDKPLRIRSKVFLEGPL